VISNYWSKMEKNKKINFLHISAADARGGAEIAAYRFHKALLEKECGSHILCGRKYYSDENVTGIMPGEYGWLVNKMGGKFFNALGLQSFGYCSSFFIKQSAWIRKWADIVMLRNVHAWYLSLGVLPWIADKAPIIWRLPDMWALTGHCAYSYTCGRWRQGCGSCSDLTQYPALRLDTTRLLWLRKKKIYKTLRDKLIFVSPSKWLQKKVEESPLTKDFRCEYIPTGVELETFRPLEKEFCRRLLGIQPDEKVIMFSCVNLKDSRKGSDKIADVMEQLQQRLRMPLVLLLSGYNGISLKVPSNVKVITTGFLDNDKLISASYNAADIYLSLSAADNLPNTLVEAAACGIPIVTLASGGCSEVLDDGKSGYIAGNIAEVVESSASILQDDAKRKNFAVNARLKAEENFSMSAQIEQYVQLAGNLVSHELS
jgi:glycosyltransferase involved in cell wall biosynthesis